jgi:predicted NAD-dependent protein-ADP-ribosyltransferase YbiA (DUF1768 family)
VSILNWADPINQKVSRAMSIRSTPRETRVPDRAPQLEISGGRLSNNGNQRATHVFFYRSDDPYYELTNFYDVSKRQGGTFHLWGYTWKNSEAPYQARKALGAHRDPRYQARMTPRGREILDSYSRMDGRQAFNAGRAHVGALDERSRATFTAWWTAHEHDPARSPKLLTMRAILEAKFSNTHLRNVLKGTGSRTLVEDAGANDGYWGNGPDGNGSNWLGRLLMRIR